jgi:hypothetical protein
VVVRGVVDFRGFLAMRPNCRQIVQYDGESWPIRVTRCVCEEMSQNVAKPIFSQKIFITSTAEKSILATFVIFEKLPKVINHPMGENSPNLVTLKLISGG